MERAGPSVVSSPIRPRDKRSTFHTRYGWPSFVRVDASEGRLSEVSPLEGALSGVGPLKGALSGVGPLEGALSGVGPLKECP